MRAMSGQRQMLLTLLASFCALTVRCDELSDASEEDAIEKLHEAMEEHENKERKLKLNIIILTARHVGELEALWCYLSLSVESVHFQNRRSRSRGPRDALVADAFSFFSLSLGHTHTRTPFFLLLSQNSEPNEAKERDTNHSFTDETEKETRESWWSSCVRGRHICTLSRARVCGAGDGADRDLAAL